ncbi:MAG: hypothetical protein ACXADO_09270 [Candidatus Thorarchaeota archaeon]
MESEGSFKERRNYRKGVLIVGSVGAALLAASAVIYMPLVLLDFPNYWLGTYYAYPYAIVLPAIVLFVGMLLHSFAYVGFYMNHKSGMGITTFLFALVASGLFLLMLLLSVRIWIPSGEYTLDFGLAWSAFGVLSAAFFLIGISLIVDSPNFKEKSVMISSGIMYIIAGSLIVIHITSMVVPIGWVVLFVAAALFIVGLSGSMKEGEIEPASKVAARAAGARPGPYAPQRAPSFCPYCGRRTLGTPFCAFCGKRVP